MTPIRHKSIHFEHILKTLGILMLIGTFTWYGLYQAKDLISGPSLTLTEDPPTIQHENIIHMKGLAKNTTSLTLNGKAIFIDEKGIFSQTIVLENGYTIQTLRAKDRFGRSVTLSRPYVYKPL